MIDLTNPFHELKSKLKEAAGEGEEEDDDDEGAFVWIM